jgi:DUF1680 family protein
MLVTTALAALTHAAESSPSFNRAPLKPKPYAELSLGTIRPEGWLREELQRMATGMSGHLDEWYPEVCGDRNGWLGGDGDTWERGPYWIDGLYPLAQLLDDKPLQAKAQKWIEWTLTHQRDDGYIGPVEIPKSERKTPPPSGAQVGNAHDWWPRMVMLKILQQYYGATRDPRVLVVLDKYFRYQLKMIPGDVPLHHPKNPKGGSWWAAQRGGDNLMVVLWFYNITGHDYLLDLANEIYQQTIPVTEWFEKGDVLQRMGPGKPAFHCVNLAQAMKTPLIRFQQDGDPRHLAATRKGLADIQIYQGQAHGLYGGDEHMHGPTPDRGSELCSAVEMMFSLEKMLEITGAAEFGDQLEKTAFNVLPTQTTDDHRRRQYFQQVNQVQVTKGTRGFFNDGGARLVYGLLQGYPCCTCNLHQGWPKFTQHLWMASADGGLAALTYAPNRLTLKVAGVNVKVREETFYPFDETVRFTFELPSATTFPLHLRIPGWCQSAQIRVNGKAEPQPKAGSIAVIQRTWKHGDRVDLVLPMTIRKSLLNNQNVAIERGPLLYALRVEESWTEEKSRPSKDPTAPPNVRGALECRPASAWNYALLDSLLKQPDQNFKLIRQPDAGKQYPWNLAGAPLELHTTAVRLPDWKIENNSAGLLPASPRPMPEAAVTETIRLIPYGCSTVRIAAFPWINDAKPLPK